ncbi:MAG TPA: hypothetical protein PLO99_00525 [Chitinophagaceae bacterium]|jgi:hypothetical protein|nr:hypothetical protein [Chitinophagaceae bacterium]HRG91418.1 hypothetical protein [Chitinophagaceae bacterium]
MFRLFLLVQALFFLPFLVQGQEDSLDNERLAKMVSLSEVVIRNKLDVALFMDQVRKDTSFYKAFRNLHVLGFTAWNDIRIRDKKGNTKASLQSKTRQLRDGGCRSMEVLDQNSSGDFFDEDGNYNYYSGELYAGLFFTKGKVCGENNIVKGVDFRPRSRSGMAKHKEQLKMLFFNPGKKIPGIPFIGDKIDIFDPDRAALYDFSIGYDDYEGESCYIFTIQAKEDLRGKRNAIVIDKMVTWFHTKTMEVMARNYDMSYDAGVYDFDVHMEVQMTKFGAYLVPKLLRYTGNWDVVFKKRERSNFTATLFNFSN